METLGHVDVMHCFVRVAENGRSVLHGVDVALFSYTVVKQATGRSGYVFRVVVPVLYG